MGPPPAGLGTALAKAPRTTGEVLALAVAAHVSVPRASPALETVTILPSGTDSPPDRLGVVLRARRLLLHGRACERDEHRRGGDGRLR